MCMSKGKAVGRFNAKGYKATEKNVKSNGKGSFTYRGKTLRDTKPKKK